MQCLAVYTINTWTLGFCHFGKATPSFLCEHGQKLLLWFMHPLGSNHYWTTLILMQTPQASAYLMSIPSKALLLEKWGSTWASFHIYNIMFRETKGLIQPWFFNSRLISRQQKNRVDLSIWITGCNKEKKFKGRVRIQSFEVMIDQQFLDKSIKWKVQIWTKI